MKRNFVFAAMITLFTISASAQERVGRVSFNGVSVRIVINETKEFFQIGESRFSSKVMHGKSGRYMSASREVGINTWNETLTATVFLEGGNGGNIEGFQEYPCDDARVTITRLKEDGTQTIVKNECAFLR